MPLIDNIKIGPVTFDVSEVDDLHCVNDEGKKVALNGHITYDDSKVRVNAGMSIDRQIVTLWHEACHGILDNAAQESHPEHTIIALAFGLVQLIRDNPELIALTVSRQTQKSDRRKFWNPDP